VQDAAVLNRLKKCLDRANHPNTSEKEASAALIIANRIMQQHNITHADMLAREEEANGSEKSPSQYSGSSIVAICSTKDSDHVVNEGFVDTAVHAMEKFFDCKSFSTKYYFPKTSIEWTFYGIAENTVAAAMAFEMVYNLIVEWARSHRGRSASYSYCTGVADGLYRTAVKEKSLEEERARQAETDDLAGREREEHEQRQRELDRLNDSLNAVDEEQGSDGDSMAGNDVFRPHFEQQGIECIDLTMDVGDAINQVLKGEEDHLAEQKIKHEGRDYMDLTVDDDNSQPRNVKQEPGVKEEMTDLTADGDSHPVKSESDATVKAGKTSHVHDHNQQQVKTENPNSSNADTDMPMDQPGSVWKSEMQLVRFRESAEKIAQSYLEQNNIKIRTTKKRKASVKDYDSYTKGRKDSKKINVRQRLIEQA
jgi:hypothetical protein